MRSLLNIKYLVLFFSIFACLFSATTAECGAVNKVIKFGKESIDKIPLISKKADNLSDSLPNKIYSKYSDESIQNLNSIYQIVPTYRTNYISDIISYVPEARIQKISELCYKYPDFYSVISSKATLEFISKCPEDHIEPFYKVVKHCPSETVGVDIFRILSELPESASTKTLKTIGDLSENGDISPKMLRQLTRALNGRNYSPSEISELFRILGKKGPGTNVAGDLGEKVAEKAINFRALPGGSFDLLDLKPGTKVIPGHHTGNVGIDLIGVNNSGRPVILEVKAGQNPYLGSYTDGVVQMSPEWIADRWTKLISDSKNIENLQKLGIDSKYFNTKYINTDVIKSDFSRKIIAPSNTSVSNLPKAGLSGLYDVIYM